MSVPKWTEDRTAELTSFVGDESPVSQATVAEAAENLETSTRSVSSKLRKMGYEVEPASAAATKAYTEEQEATLAAFVQDNSGQYTYADIAAAFADGAFSAKSIQGKILSMELTEHVKPAPVRESVRTYSEAEEAKFVAMVNDGAFIEDLVEALGRPVNSIRGKALSLLRSGDITGIPKQRESASAEKVDPFADLGDVSDLTVAEIAEKIEKTPRGVKAMLTRRGINAADWKGADRREKADKASA